MKDSRETIIQLLGISSGLSIHGKKDEINMADGRLSPLLKHQQRGKSSKSAFYNLQTEIVNQRKGNVEDGQFYSIVSRDG